MLRVTSAISRRCGAIVAAVTALAMAYPGHAQEPTHIETRGRRIAVVPFDALGLDGERVVKLEALFRNEIGRLSGTPGPGRRDVIAAMARGHLSECTGEARCLTQIGTRLGVDMVVSGNVAELGDSYVVNIKVVGVASGAELSRTVSDPLRGNPDELIEAVRVSAYRLLAPGRLRGSIVLLADLAGATVELDGKPVGKTPLAHPLRGLALGKHRLTVSKDGFSSVSRPVLVRFQKTTKVVVRLATEPAATRVTARPDLTRTPRLAETQRSRREDSWYQSTWFMVGVGIVAVSAGAVVGWQLGKDRVVDCTGGRCASH